MALIEWRETADGLEAGHLGGFFDGWPTKPSPETLLRTLRGSSHVVLAADPETGDVVGFITAISDGVLAASIPLLEVRRDHRGRGLGRELVERMLARLGGIYMVDLSCDANVAWFYTKLGFTRGIAMMKRERSGLR